MLCDFRSSSKQKDETGAHTALTYDQARRDCHEVFLSHQITQNFKYKSKNLSGNTESSTMDGYKGCELLNTTKRCHSTDGVNRKNKNVPVDMTDRELEGGSTVTVGFKCHRQLLRCNWFRLYNLIQI